MWGCLDVFLEFREVVSPHGGDGAALNEMEFVAVVTANVEIFSQFPVEPHIVHHLQQLLVLTSMTLQG